MGIPSVKKVAICFSGHPRIFLNNTASWDQYFSMIRSEYDLSIYFHCWADHGLVHFSNGKYIEGEFENGYYPDFQRLISYLQPAAFCIESFSPEVIEKGRNLSSVILTSWQAGRKKILSQLYSISRSDALRRNFERSECKASDVIIRMRFDVKPANFTLNEIRYVAVHPEMDILFAPSPAWHGHPGGGGGCKECHAFFDDNWLKDGFERCINQFIERHPQHSNDICDLFAVGNPSVMKRYANIFNDAEQLNFRLLQSANRSLLDDYELVPDADDVRDKRIAGTKRTPWDIERSPAFIPEKLIRLQMIGSLVVHGESIFIIDRR